jgi:hypothetical protein
VVLVTEKNRDNEQRFSYLSWAIIISFSQSWDWRVEMGEEMVFLNDNEIRFCRKDIIGRGGNGVVFRGSFSGQDVAVKRIQLIDANYKLNSRELLNLRQLKHDNIVEFIHVEDNDDFRYNKLLKIIN